MSLTDIEKELDKIFKEIPTINFIEDKNKSFTENVMNLIKEYFR